MKMNAAACCGPPPPELHGPLRLSEKGSGFDFGKAACMLKSTVVHPEILAALGAAGHGVRILIADGNYPPSIHQRLPNPPKVVFLNLAPGVVSVSDTLRALKGTLPMERVQLMQTATGDPAPVWKEFEEILADALPNGWKPDFIERFAFYESAKEPDVHLVIVTADLAHYANVLVTIGVRSQTA